MPHQEYKQSPDEARDFSVHAHILVGPTAVGKTSVAHILAERARARIISADSMLVYCGMDIGTAKPSREELRRFDYVGVDIVAPGSDFNLALYLEHVRSSLANRPEMPLIVVGGTGLYVKALTRGLDDAGEPDADLRATAEKLLAEQGIAALREYAARQAPQAYARVKDKDNPRRLIRALESRAGSPPRWNQRATTRIVGLRMERESLARRIAVRVERMHADGLLAETAALLESGQLSRTARQAIGYREAIAVLKGEMEWPAAREQICLRTRRLAKSQMTWFRNQEQVDWIDVDKYDDERAVAARVEELWEINGTSRIRF
jgi:tRNA dimethylallyltransferase